MAVESFFCRNNDMDSDAAQRCTEEFLQGLLGAIDSLIIAFDLDQRVLFANTACRSIIGVEAEALCGKKLSELFPRGRIEEAQHFFEQAHKGPTDELLSTFLVSADGTNIPMLISAAPMRGVDGTTGIIFFAQDQQQQKRLEAQLLQGQKLEAVGQLAAGVAHEINTPMQYIGDNVEFLRTGFADLVALVNAADKTILQEEEGKRPEGWEAFEKLKTDFDWEYMVEEMPKALEQTREGITSVTKIVRSLKAFSHPGSETMDLHDLNQVIEDTVTVAKNEWKYVADVETNFDSSMGLVPCHLGELNQVVLNMIVNAAHAVGSAIAERGEPKGCIKLTTRRTDTSAQIIIEDNGTGIPEELRSKIYDPFFTTKEVGKGTGQGLAIAHRIITEKHNGKIDLESRPGFTRFVLDLPLKQAVVGEES